MTLPAYVPPALASLPQWVFWQYELTTTGKVTKVPYQADAWRTPAASTRPEEWTTYAVAAANAEWADKAGVGFVFAAGGGVFGIDVDDLEKVAPEHQDTAFRLRQMLAVHFPTYREVSPSGKGCHYIGYGSLPAEIGAIKDSKYGIEVYDKHRFFTFTGNVIDGMSDVVDCQEALNDLAQTMRGSAVAARGAYVNQDDARSVEQVVAAISGWANGDEFRRLMFDPLNVTLSRYNNDHSAADLALGNFIAAGTKDVNLAVNIFRGSPLWREGGKGGYKPEQKYIDDYLVRTCFGKVWAEKAIETERMKVAVAEGDRIGNEIIAAMERKEAVDTTPAIPAAPGQPKAEKNSGAYARRYSVKLPYLDTSDPVAHIPPGVAGMFVDAVQRACPTPVPEFALAVSLAFLSGVIGRAYRFRGQGLNTFFMVGAKSATGKTQSITAVQNLLASLNVPQMGDRFYSISGKSVQGLQSYFERFPAGAWITDECGAQLKVLTAPTSQADHELKDAINSLFDAASPGKKWRPPASMRSNREDKPITCLSVGVGWFTTREKIYTALGDSEIADGFLSRFTPIFYNGVMGDDNFNVATEFPDRVKKTLETMWPIILENDMHMPLDGVANQTKAVNVGITDEAKDAFHMFGIETRNLTRRAQAESDDLPEHFIAMARVGITAQRLAGVCAVLDNPVMPVIQMQHVTWAIQFVGSRMLHVLELIATGEVGNGDSIEVPTVIRMMRRLMRKHGPRVPSYDLHDRLRSVIPFKEARIGAMNAVKQAVNNLVDEGRLLRFVDEHNTVGRPTTYYQATHHDIWK